MLGNSVIHVNDDLHAIVKSYCGEREIRMVDWVDATLRKAMDSGPVLPGTMLVSQRDLPKTILGGEQIDKLYQKPPFWAGRRIL